MSTDRLIFFDRDIHDGEIAPGDTTLGPSILRTYEGLLPDGLPFYTVVLGANYTTSGVCLLLDIKPRELQERALRLGWIYWDPERGLQTTPMDPETCFMPVGFFYGADPNCPEKFARYKRTIADAWWAPESLESLGLIPDGERADH